MGKADDALAHAARCNLVKRSSGKNRSKENRWRIGGEKERTEEGRLQNRGPLRNTRRNYFSIAAIRAVRHRNTINIARNASDRRAVKGLSTKWRKLLVFRSLIRERSGASATGRKTFVKLSRNFRGSSPSLELRDYSAGVSRQNYGASKR